MIFSYYTNNNQLTINNMKNYKQQKDFKPKGIWFAKRKIWYNYVLYELPKNNKNRVKYKYNVKVDMKNIYILKSDKVKEFYDKYTIDKGTSIPITINKTQLNIVNYVINWCKFTKENPLSTGFYIDFDPHGYRHPNKWNLSLTELFKQGDIMFMNMWDLPSICVWDKTAIIEFKYEKQMH
jgi:hypothetical protein